ncbi:MAG: hypothetical protein ACOY5B_08475, partial [Spirochaetota bacterium]
STAEVAYNNQVAALNALKNTYATNFTHYTSAMNRMADAFKTFQVENSDFEKKQAIKDFATTAYLFANSSQASSANEADAYQMYLAAKQNYDTVSAQLTAKADEVRTQDTLTQLSDLIQKIDAGTPLNAQETAMRATYQNFIDARKDYVLESERMIRVKKAQEILNAEIEKRKQIAELKLAAYNKAKDDLIGYADPQNTAAVYNRDKTIAAFQALLASGGPDRIAGVIKGMAYIDDMSMNMSGKLFANSGGPEMDEPAVISDWNGGKNIYNTLNPADKALLDQFRANIANGQLNSANFQAMKAAAVEVLKKKELYHESIIRYNWAYGVGTPLIASGSVMIGIGYGFFAAAAAALASFFGSWAAPGLFAAGSLAKGVGTALVLSGLALIIPATIDMNNKDNDHNSASKNADDQRNAIVTKLNTIKAKEEEYLAAKAALDYFTKAPSQQVLKERLVQWGTQAGGYQLSDADLRYVKDDKSNYTDSTGATYAAGAHCPPTGLCGNDAARALNITSSITTPKFETAAGDKYDPSQVTTQNLESTLEGGFYWLNGEKYVKIKQMNHAGQMTDMYAKYLTADVAPGGVWDMYNLGDVMNMSSNHSDALRSQLKQGYVTAGGSHEQTLMLNEREKTMWSIWNYADAQGKQYKGFQQMAGDYQENSTNVFQVQQQQNAALVTQQWDLRRAELDAARARWENLANTIETRGMESFNASEQKFLKAWRQWEIDTNRKIDAGKKQWDDKMKTFLVSKQNWQDEIKAAAMEQSLEKMLGATGSALNDRLKALSANINIPVDVPEINVANLVQAAMADFERSKPSNERLFGEINKSITAFNVTLELGNATHFKGFNSTSLEGDFASNMETFSKKMAILNNVKMYESFKKLIEDFKESLRKNDQNVTSGLTTAATLANYRQDGGWYTKDMGWAFGGKYGFSAYQHADVDGLMNRGMREAGMTIMSGDEMVNFLEKGRDVDVKLFFEVQTMALEQAFKIVGGDKSKKGLYGEWVGEAPQYNNDGDESNQGSGELGGWAGGQMDNKKTYRGLNKEEKRLSTIQGSITAAMNVTASLAAAATGNVALLVTLAGTQATYSTGSAIASGRDAGGSLAMGAIDFGIAFGGALMGPGVAATAARSSLNFARAGIAQNPDGTVNLDFKGNWSKGGGASAAFSGALSVLGEAAGAKITSKGWGAVVNGAFDAIGSGVKFDSGGISGFSFASAIGSGIGSAVSYGFNPANTKSGSQYSGSLGSQMLSSEMGKAATAVTTAILGAAMNDSQAAASFTSTYQNVNGFSAMGGILGRVVNMRIEESRAVDAAKQSRESGQPLTQEMIGALARAVMRRKEEEAEAERSGAQSGSGSGEAGGGGDANATQSLLTLSAGATQDDPSELMRGYFANARLDAENMAQLHDLRKSGVLSDGDMQDIAKQQVANNREAGFTKNLKLVPTYDFDGFMSNLGSQYKMSAEDTERMYVLANNPTLDPSDADAYTAARDSLKAKMSQGGTIQMPAGAGEYTSRTDKQFGYDKVRAERAAAARFNEIAGSLINNKQSSAAIFAPYLNSKSTRYSTDTQAWLSQFPSGAQGFNPAIHQKHNFTFDQMVALQDDKIGLTGRPGLRPGDSKILDYGAIIGATIVSGGVLGVAGAGPAISVALGEGMTATNAAIGTATMAGYNVLTRGVAAGQQMMQSANNMALRAGDLLQGTGPIANQYYMQAHNFFADPSRAQYAANFSMGLAQGGYTYLSGTPEEKRTVGDFIGNSFVGGVTMALGTPISGQGRMGVRTGGAFIYGFTVDAITQIKTKPGPWNPIQSIAAGGWNAAGTAYSNALQNRGVPGTVADTASGMTWMPGNILSGYVFR